MTRALLSVVRSAELYDPQQHGTRWRLGSCLPAASLGPWRRLWSRKLWRAPEKAAAEDMYVCPEALLAVALPGARLCARNNIRDVKPGFRSSSGEAALLRVQRRNGPGDAALRLDAVGQLHGGGRVEGS
ncbi:unnamed protein product [Arctogadus glacialis]